MHGIPLPRIGEQFFALSSGCLYRKNSMRLINELCYGLYVQEYPNTSIRRAGLKISCLLTDSTRLNVPLFSRSYDFESQTLPSTVRSACTKHNQYDNRACFTNSSFTPPCTAY
ncbi:uncharacterized protein LOC114878913 [Osmia bicornis bicornis]|uniref:uncharacterized protein LOC114878913 n=1 Tax=Osmia bicornis bicornis TaxID=1437191 RepID=UPI0010F79234|nr:uncharacterized protein LOC114878913 [Osmia bicornis bicornis]